jgi:tetratricopeptide (TPR) repeat protein
LVHLQISPIYHDDNTGSLEKYLITNKFVTPLKNAEPVWHLVHTQRAGGRRRLGDAGILCDYFDMTDDSGQPFWLTWTKDHPQLAKIVWPIVARLARQQLYVLIPELMTLAKSARNGDVLQRTVDNYLVAKYVEMASLHQQNDEHEIALDILSEAIKSHPKSAELYQTRAKSHDALRKKGEAAEDRLRANTLREGVGSLFQKKNEPLG